MKKTIGLKFGGKKRIDVLIGEQVIPTDQTVENGGRGAAPEPFQLFLASIAACAGIYALEFCLNRGISTEGMKLTMECERDQKLKRYTSMSIHLKLPEGFPEKFQKAIIRSMNLCTVKKHIIVPPEFTITAGN